MRRLLARVTVPPDGSSCPIRMRRRVVLPMPLGPTSAKRAPLATENVTPEKRSSAPKDLERELTVISDIFLCLGAMYCAPTFSMDFLHLPPTWTDYLQCT